MVRKLKIWVWLACISMLLPCGSAYAKTGEETMQEAGGSQVLAGVSVDYTGRLEFLVLNRDTDLPVASASVEVYVPGEDRYMLVGVTDQAGGLKVNAESGSEIRYRVYRSGWLPYPQEGSVKLQQAETVQTVTVYLYRKGGGGGGSGSSGGSATVDSVVVMGSGQPGELHEIQEAYGSNTTGIPKTGVEGTAGYWLAAMIFLLSAGVILGYLLKLEKDREEKDYGR